MYDEETRSLNTLVADIEGNLKLTAENQGAINVYKYILLCTQCMSHVVCRIYTYAYEKEK